MNDTEPTVAYDGSFPGFLCACAEVLNARDPIPRPVREIQTQSLFEDRIIVRRDDARAAALWERLSRKIPQEPMDALYDAFLSELPGIDAAIAAVMRRMWHAGACRSLDLSDPEALAVEKAANRAREEGHRFCGLVRFSELSDGSSYSAIEPSCNILQLIGDHFSSRFSPMRFAIHDTIRHRAILHEPGRSWDIIEGFELDLTTGTTAPDRILEKHLAGREREIRSMWARYFETIAIESRKNPRLQTSKVPRKYRAHLVEFQGYGHPAQSGPEQVPPNRCVMLRRSGLLLFRPGKERDSPVLLRSP